MTDFYFAYGSNLDVVDWTRFCGEHGADPRVLTPIGPATLPDEILVFDCYSSRRQCGALNIRTHRGGAVEGAVFAVSGDGWEALDRKEGHPHRYAREVLRVHVGGQMLAVQTYRVIPNMRGGFCAPDSHYMRICRRGRQRHGLPLDQLEQAVQGLVVS